MRKFIIPILTILALFPCGAIRGQGIWQPDIMNFPHFIYLYNNAPTNDERAGVVREFRQMIDKTGTPITEGDKCYFIYTGQVDSSANVVGFFNAWKPEDGQLQQLGTTGIYFKEYTFPVDARLDYKFIIDGKWMLDPRNPDKTAGGFGFSSEMRMPKWKPSDWTIPREDVPPGIVDTLQWNSTYLPGERKIYIYRPHDYNPGEEYPILYTQDGLDYIRFGHILTCADNLIAAGKIHPLIMVLIDPIHRREEYGLNPDYLKMISEEILPAIRSNYSVTDDRRLTGILGDSFGGLAAFYVGLERPDLFGMIAGQSGHYAYKENWIMEFAQRMDGDSLYRRPEQQAFLQVGTFERQMQGFDLTQASESFRDILKQKRIKVSFVEAPEDHSWAFWRRILPDILIKFYGV